MKILPFLVAAGAAVLAGCVHVDQTLTLNEDGSGSLEVVYGMSLADLEQVQAFAGQAEGEASAGPLDFNEDAIRKDFEDYRRYGVRLESVRTEEKEGWKYIRMNVTFRNLAGLARTELVADRALSLVKNGEGNYVFRQSISDALPGVEAEGADEESVAAMMEGLMKGFRARVRVSVPGRILDSTGGVVEGRSASWEYDLAKDPKAVQRLQRADMRVVFEGAGLKLDELKAKERSP